MRKELFLLIIIIFLGINFIFAGDPSSFTSNCASTGCFIYAGATNPCGNSPSEISYIIKTNPCATSTMCSGNNIVTTVTSSTLPGGKPGDCYSAVKASCSYTVACQSGYYCDPSTVTCVPICVPKTSCSQLEGPGNQCGIVDNGCGTGTLDCGMCGKNGTCENNICRNTCNNKNDAVALYDTTTGTFYFRTSQTGGISDMIFGYGVGNVEQKPISGDWNGDGVDTIGIYDKNTGGFLLKNDNSAGNADISIYFGGIGDGRIYPIAGDWDNDSIDTIGFYNPVEGVFYFKNKNQQGSGNADFTISFGTPGDLHQIPIVGDWNGDGIDEIGLFYNNTNRFVLKSNLINGNNSNLTSPFGNPLVKQYPIAGDWDNDGKDSIGIFDVPSASFILSNDNSMQALVIEFGQDNVDRFPISGDWCSLGEYCDDSQTIMKLTDSRNAHGSLWNDPSITWRICFDKFFGANYTKANARICSEKNQILNLASTTNSHASILNDYTNNICFGGMDCRNISSGECNSSLGEKTILSLAANTNAHISYGDDPNYPYKICCRAIFSIPGNTYWQNMNNSIISNANVKDSILMVINRSEYILGKEINYTLYKQNGSGFLFWHWDKKIGQLSSIGFATLKINETGNFYFNASVEGYNDVYSSNTLSVTDEEDTPPSIKIIKPLENSTFIINTTIGLTNPISFEQTSSDVDDMIDVYWNFDDGNSIRLYNCNNGTSNCNTTHQYNSTYVGTRIVRATALENERSLSEYDLSRFFVYKEGLNLFIIIDSPNYKLKELPAVILVNATSTKIANCSLTSAICSAGGTRICSEIADSSNNKLYCYTYAKSDNPKFKFRWTLDGSTNPNYPTNASPFPIILSQGGKHDIGVTVSFNMSN